MTLLLVTNLGFAWGTGAAAGLGAGKRLPLMGAG